MFIDCDDPTVQLDVWVSLNDREFMLSFLCANSGAAEELNSRLADLGLQGIDVGKVDSPRLASAFRRVARNLPTYAIPLDVNAVAKQAVVFPRSVAEKPVPFGNLLSVYQRFVEGDDDDSRS